MTPVGCEPGSQAAYTIASSWGSNLYVGSLYDSFFMGNKRPISIFGPIFDVEGRAEDPDISIDERIWWRLVEGRGAGRRRKWGGVLRSSARECGRWRGYSLFGPRSKMESSSSIFGAGRSKNYPPSSIFDAGTSKKDRLYLRHSTPKVEKQPFQLRYSTPKIEEPLLSLLFDSEDQRTPNLRSSERRWGRR